MDIKKIREDMPLCKQYAYLDTAAAAPPPIQVVDAMTDYLQKTAYLGPYLPEFRKETYEKVDKIREQVAAFIGAKAEELAFSKNGTEAINMIANGLDWKEGDEVILADCEFHSNFVPWLALKEKGKITLKVLKTGESGKVNVSRMESMITEKTRLITVSHLPNASGALQPIEEICKIARKYGVLTLINASQTLGMVPINVYTLGCDFLVACGRKGLRGPEGSGILFMREELIKSMTPSTLGWGGTVWDFETNEYSFLPIAKRMEAGCPLVPNIIGLGAAVEYGNQIGVNTIYERVKSLTSYLIEKVSTIPNVSIYGPSNQEDRFAILPFNIEGIPPENIMKFLEDNGIIIEAGSFMANTMLQQYGISKMARISLHYFNTKEEIDKAISLIHQMMGKMEVKQ